ncbi:MAG: AAA family ATPase [Myxococcales bacterium]|nr:AAA family ATPase [Myxococcales bacterium]
MPNPPQVKPPRPRSPIVGRERELEMLEATLSETTRSSSPQMVTLVGATGLGKSRLLREFLTNVRTREGAPRVLSVMSRGEGVAFAPIRAMLRDRLGISEGADEPSAAASFRDGVAAVIGDDESSTDFLHFLGGFAGVPMPDSPLVKAVSTDAHQTHQVQRAVLTRFLELDARTRPLLLTFEDLHRADDDTIELLKHLASGLRRGPIMVVFVGRPEFPRRHPDWVCERNHQRFELSPLEPDDAAELFENLLSQAEDVPDELVDAAVDLAGGNPYLLEQLVQAFIQQGVVIPTDSGAGPWQVRAERLDESRLPLTVDDAIESRIASLRTQERSLLEMAASLGGVFWSGALVALEREGQSPPPHWHGATAQRAQVEAMLDDLVARDYLLSMPDSTIPGDREFAFKHNLEREALHCYTSAALLSQYHLRIAQWLECRLAADNEEHCALLAQHYEQGGAGVRAARYYLSAARLARQRYAPARVCEYAAQGLRLLSRPVSVQRLDVLEPYGQALHQQRRSEEAIAALEEAKGIAYQLDLPARAADIYLESGKVRRDSGRLSLACEDYDTACTLYESIGDETGAINALDGHCRAAILRGRLEVADRLIRVAVKRLRASPERLGQLARCQVSLGSLCREARHLEAADRAFAKALENYRRAEDPQGVAAVLCLRGTVAGQRAQADAAETLFRQGLEAARACGDRAQEVLALTCLGSAGYRRGNPRAAVSLLQQAANLAETLANRLLEADTLRSLGKARALAGEQAMGFADAERARLTFDRAGARPQLGVTLRTLGEICARGTWPGKPDTWRAEDYFEQSIQILHEIRYRSEQARSYRAYAAHLARGEPGQQQQQRAEQLRAKASELLAQEPPGSVPPGVPPVPENLAGA